MLTVGASAGGEILQTFAHLPSRDLRAEPAYHVGPRPGPLFGGVVSIAEDPAHDLACMLDAWLSPLPLRWIDLALGAHAPHRVLDEVAVVRRHEIDVPGVVG